MDGSKILSMVVENLHFLDSLNYLPMSLKRMPKSFDLKCKKGYYAHFFFTASSMNYVGPYPEPEFYGADSIPADEHGQLMQWHEEQKGKLFCNKDELLAYCMDDVNVLRQACCAFRNLFLKLVEMDPFREAITISSICNKVFRTMFLKSDNVGIIPRAVYRMEDRQSFEDLQWLAYIGRSKNIIHAGNGREDYLAGGSNVKVDGYYQDTNEVFEYLGCFWHGCLCMPNRHKPNGNTDEALQNRCEETGEVAKNQKRWLQCCFDLGCQFRKLFRNTPGPENELCSHPYVKKAPINIRDALYGCTNEATKTYYRVEDGKNPDTWMSSVCTHTFVSMLSLLGPPGSVRGCRLSP